jgi:hypothetical protein
MITIDLEINKVCSCGKVWHHLPPTFTVFIDEFFGGVYFDCVCKSTIWVPWVKIKQDAA